MFEKRKVWAAVGTAMSTALVTSASVNAQPADYNFSNDQVSHIVAPFEGEGGEGEGEGAGGVDLRTNDAAFLAQLGLIRGHLHVGKQLFDQGHLAMAKTHMKHPKDELYAGLEPAFTARNLPGFASELTVLANSVLNDMGEAAVNAAYTQLLEAIAANEPLQQTSVNDVLMSISNMLLVAGEEYDIGVKQGEIVNVHEFQDAYGFTRMALARLDRLSAEQQANHATAIAEVREILQSLPELWPTITPTGRIEGDSSHLYGAAARIELAAMN